IPESYRFSRALILLGYIITNIVTFFTRFIATKIQYLPNNLILNKKQRTLIAGTKEEIYRVKNILQKTIINPQIIGFIAPTENTDTNFYLGELSQIEQIIKINKADELIFCAKNISSQQIIKNMLMLSDTEIDFKIAPTDSISVIGSNSINTAGELYTIEINPISKISNKIIKRFFDLLTSLLIILLSPLLLLFYKKPLNIIRNSFTVISGQKTWIGYCNNNEIQKLPKIKNSIFCVNNNSENKSLSNSDITKLNLQYAKNYKIMTDIKEFLRNLKHINKQDLY
ncbi:MAG: hypothetical protein U9R54_09180, partial [Bacteroidota bacterium]|nr:hypothetical protein [Bacteroidota bacterium]